MTTYEMLRKSIEVKKRRGALSADYTETTKAKMDVFLMNDRITQEEYNLLVAELQ